MIDRPNQVWSADITYIPIGRGFLYLVAIMDWASRAVLAWRLSNTHGRVVLRLGARRGAGPLRHAGDLQHRPGQPIHQHRLHRHAGRGGGSISMDGRGRWMDNVFIERLWRSLKYEDIYLKGYADGREAQGGDRRVDRLLQSPRARIRRLANRTPMAVWRTGASGALGRAAVDITLRLDNAGALSTYPQPHHQQQAA